MDDRIEWLAVALDAIGEWAGEVFMDACRHVSQTCSHPSKIVPAFVAFAEPAEQRLRNRIAFETQPRRQHYLLPAPEPLPPMTQADVDELPPHLVKLGLACGALAKNADGNVVLAPDEADAA